MKTTNIVLIGVVGVGAVGAYMYMKNKKAQDNVLSGSLPATTPTGTPTSGTAPSGTAPTGTPPSGTAPSGTPPSSTPPQNNEVFLPSNNDLKLLDATILLGKIKNAQLAVVDSKKPFIGNKNAPINYTGFFKPSAEYEAYLLKRENASKVLMGLTIELHNLGYEVDANNNLVKLDPNRDKQKSLKAIGYKFDVIALKEKMKEPFEGNKFKNNSGNEAQWNWTMEYTMFNNLQSSYPIQLQKLLNDLEDVDYSLDSSNNLIKLDPNRNKEWIKVQRIYTFLLGLDYIGTLRNQAKVKELASYGYKIDPTTKKLVTI
jgi:hypothetical protein